ncbi:MAG: NADH-quinone oxidoreductase subunit N [Bdellovibrionota bacterium]
MDQLIKPQNLTLSREQLAMMMPYLILAVGAMATLLVGVMKSVRSNLVVAGLSLITVAAAILSVVSVWGEPSMTLFNGMLAADAYSNLFNVLLLGTTGLVLLSSYSYLEKEGIHYAEYYSLGLFSCLGMMLLASSLDLVVLFIALETMSIGVYVLVGFRRADVRSNEAALKYFVLGSAASAIMLFGIALMYGATGTMNIHQIITLVTSAAGIENTLFLLGTTLVIAGFLFKVATVPFHMWMPDVYEGAPTSVTNFMTTALKAAAFASFMRVFMSLGFAQGLTSKLNMGIHDVLWVIAVATMFLGNVIALTQQNIKRMLAYSSIAHSGYIIVGFLAGGRSEYGFTSVVVYLIAYVVMNLGAFAIVSLLGERGDRNTDVQDYAGLGFKNPALGFAMAVFMFSMAGIPPTLGFAGKYLIFSSAVQAGEITLAVLAVLCSAISAYYYLRVIVYMYMKEPMRERKVEYAYSTSLVILAATIATLQFGIFPSALIEAAKKAATL